MKLNFLKFLIISVLVSTTLSSWALDFKPGNYELIKGDDSICEEGPLQIKDGQLSIGAKLIFLKYQTPQFNFLNDEKDCQYSIKNNHDKTHYEQQLTINCKKAPIYDRSIKFHYESADKLIMTVIQKNKTETCELKLKK